MERSENKERGEASDDFWLDALPFFYISSLIERIDVQFLLGAAIRVGDDKRRGEVWKENHVHMEWWFARKIDGNLSQLHPKQAESSDESDSHITFREKSRSTRCTPRWMRSPHTNSICIAISRETTRRVKENRIVVSMIEITFKARSTSDTSSWYNDILN